MVIFSLSGDIWYSVLCSLASISKMTKVPVCELYFLNKAQSVQKLLYNIFLLKHIHTSVKCTSISRFLHDKSKCDFIWIITLM